MDVIMNLTFVNQPGTRINICPAQHRSIKAKLLRPKEADEHVIASN